MHARCCPQKTAVTWGGRSIAWDALNNYVHSTSRYLKEISVKPQATILIAEEKSPAYMIVILALWRIGAVPCPVDPALLRSVYASVKPDLVIAARRLKKLIDPKARYADIEQVVAYGYNDSFLGSEASLDPRIDSEQMAVLRLKISQEIVRTFAISHRQLKENPQDMGALLHTLMSAETYVI